MMSEIQPFLTYDEQLSKLKSKNLAFKNETTARKALQNISYYSLICGYKDSETNFYRRESNFEDIYMLYQFDESLRNIFFKYILKIERKIKSYYSYAFCSKFGENQAEYLNVNNYNYSQFQKEVNELNKYLSDAMEANRPYLAHHRSAHGNIPLWVLVNVLTFGNISIAYQCSQQDIRSAIAKEFVNVYPDQLTSILNVLTKFRNVCAHNERLYSYKTQKSIKSLKLHNDLLNPNQGKNDLLAICICFKYLLESETFFSFINEIQFALLSFLSKIDDNIKHDILSKMGIANFDLNLLVKYEL